MLVPIPLNQLCQLKKESLGYNLIYYSETVIAMTLLAEQTLAHQTDAEIPISTRKLKKLELATLDASDLEEPNPDEILRQAHLYDSSDKRCCINRKRT